MNRCVFFVFFALCKLLKTMVKLWMTACHECRKPLCLAGAATPFLLPGGDTFLGVIPIKKEACCCMLSPLDGAVVRATYNTETLPMFSPRTSRK